MTLGCHNTALDSDSDSNGPTPHGIVIPVSPPPAAAASPLEILETHTSLREIPEESLHSAPRNVPTTQNILRNMMRRGNQQAHLLGKSLDSLRSEHLHLEKLAPVGPCCEAGTYSLNGSTACLQCAAGYYAKESCSTACDICPAGTYSLPGSAACLECDPGYYSGTNGSSSCDECVEDTYSDSAGASTCIGCAAGSFQPTRASTECKKYELKKVSLPVILECHPGFQSGYFGQSTVGCTEHIVDNTLQDYEDVFVQMLVALPLTLDEFNDEKQQDFKYAIAKAAQVDSSDVLIRNITFLNVTDDDNNEAMYATKPTILYRDGRRIPISDVRRIQKGVRYDDVDSLSAQLRKAQAQLDQLTNKRTESSGAAQRRNLLWSAVPLDEDVSTLPADEDEPSADDITIEFLVKAKTSTLARFVVDGLTEDRVDAQLRKVGLPRANILVEPQIMYLASSRIPDFHFGMDDPRNMHHLPGSESIVCSGGSSLTGSGKKMSGKVSA